jgi:hypothetical protein
MKLPRIPLLAAVASIAAGGTVLVAGSAADLLAAALPTGMPLDTGVIVLFAPMCLLMLGLLAETTRHALIGTPSAEAVPARNRRIDLRSRS